MEKKEDKRKVYSWFASILQNQVFGFKNWNLGFK